MDDPTLEALAELDDPRLYYVKRNVPAFVPHTRTKTDPNKRDKDGSPLKVKVEVTVQDLHEIAERANRRERESGTPGLLVLGHRIKDPEYPETKQPPVVGYARNWRVGTFGPQQRPCLLYDEYVRQDWKKEAGSYPFRSVEYYPQLKEVTAVCKLKRDPELDLGVVTYGADEPCLIYSREVNMPDPTMPPDKDADDTKDMGKDTPDAGMDDAKEFDAYMRHCAKHSYARKHHEKMLKYAMEAGPESPEGGPQDLPPPPPPPPAPGKSDLPPPPPPMPEKGKDESPEAFQRRLAWDRYQRDMDRKVRELEAETQQAKIRECLVAYERDLENLVTRGGYDVKIDRELAECDGMTLDQLQRHTKARKDLIVANYSRGPVGGPVVPVVRTTPAGSDDPDEITPRHLDLALAYQRDHGEADWDTCVEKTRQQANRR